MYHLLNVVWLGSFMNLSFNKLLLNFNGDGGDFNFCVKLNFFLEFLVGCFGRLTYHLNLSFLASLLAYLLLTVRLASHSLKAGLLGATYHWLGLTAGLLRILVFLAAIEGRILRGSLVVT